MLKEYDARPECTGERPQLVAVVRQTNFHYPLSLTGLERKQVELVSEALRDGDCFKFWKGTVLWGILVLFASW